MPSGRPYCICPPPEFPYQEHESWCPMSDERNDVAQSATTTPEEQPANTETPCQTCAALRQERDHERHEKETVADAAAAHAEWTRKRIAELESSLASAKAEALREAADYIYDRWETPESLDIVECLRQRAEKVEAEQ